MINEVYIRPDGLSTTPPNGLINSGSKEYIEIYNKNCFPVDITGYYIAAKQNGFSGVVTGITFRIPNSPSALIPPGGHVVLASPVPGTGLAGNIDIPITAPDRCVYASNAVIANVDGWVALYNASGVPIDCVYWSGSAANINSNPADYNPGTLCLPTGSPVSSLPTPTQINATNPAIVSYIPNSTPVLIFRQQDGSSTWSFVSTFNAATLPWTINNASPTGNCNGGVCVPIPSVLTPTFNTIAPICSGATLAALPTTSNNGITGTWSPALNNTATTTYTFTPNTGQCATTTTLTITVNGPVTPTFTAVAPICSGATLAALPTTSNNGITGTWSPALNNTATTTYTFTPNAGQCATTT
ncbi:lamin tail domain-containing protein, partial [Flavobacterium sp.]|uniref:lamin tail domain-containing protein n=1 Tax=Flavobacterium sp. TaxID=239 RepID=UPI00262B2D94